MTKDEIFTEVTGAVTASYKDVTIKCMDTYAEQRLKEHKEMLAEHSAHYETPEGIHGTHYGVRPAGIVATGVPEQAESQETIFTELLKEIRDREMCIYCWGRHDIDSIFLEKLTDRFTIIRKP